MKMELPSLTEIMAYKGVWILATVDKKNKELKATHIACCLINGHEPMWAVWNINGTFQRFFGFRYEIKQSYPRLVWRRQMATWHLHEATNKTVKERRQELLAMQSTNVQTIKRRRRA